MPTQLSLDVSRTIAVFLYLLSCQTRISSKSVSGKRQQQQIFINLVEPKYNLPLKRPEGIFGKSFARASLFSRIQLIETQAMPSGTAIPPSEMSRRAQEPPNLVYNSADCFCGWYLTYAACGHLWHRWRGKCAKDRGCYTHRFCTGVRPVPVRQITSFHINENCDPCRARQQV